MKTPPLSALAALALLAACGDAFAQAGRKIQFSDPLPEQANTNLTRLGQGRSGLDRLESELSRPFDFIKSQNSMSGSFLTAPAPVPPPAVNNPRVKELIDRRRDLPFMTPEEAYGLPKPEDRYKAPELTADGRDVKSLRPLERALLRSSETDGGRDPRNPWADEGAERNASGGRGDALTGSEQNLRKLLDEDPLTGRRSTDRREVVDFFGNGNSSFRPPTSPRYTDSQLQRIEQFKQLYDFGGTHAASAPGQNFSREVSPYVDRSFYDPPRPPSAPAYTPPVSAGSSGGYQAYTPPAPAPQPARPAPFASPFLTVPKRDF